MPKNTAQTSLKRKRSATCPMSAHDSLPPHLRAWTATAILPWRAASVRRAYNRALARTRDAGLALQELDRIQSALVCKDAQAIWGREHPAAQANPPTGSNLP